MTEFFQLAGGLFVSFFALIVIVIGAVLISLGLFTLQRHRAAAGWPQAPGVIEVSEVAAEHHFEENLMYRPVIRYRYNAPGGPYTSDKLSSTGKLYDKERQARKITDRHPVGSSVIARYNPNDPSEAVVERDAAGGIWFVGFGVLCWIVPVAGVISAGLSWRIVAAVLAGMVLVLLTIMLKSGSSLAQARSRGLLPPADKCSAADIAALIGRGEKLLAIRLYRELNGGGLKDARLAVEELARNNQSR